MEKEIVIPLGENKNLRGILRGKTTSPLIIFVHGFTGHKNEHQFFNAARFFEKKGFSSFRFDLYSWRKDARKLEECTLSLHGKDLDSVIDYFRKEGIKKLFVVGHSFGGVTVLLSRKKNFDVAVLWDSTGDADVHINAKFIPQLNRYYFDEWAYGFTIGKDFYEENNNKLKPSKLIKKIDVPIKIITAGAGELAVDNKKLFENANKPKEFAIIPNATHCFDEDGTEEKLFEETFDWLKKFL